MSADPLGFFTFEDAPAARRAQGVHHELEPSSAALAAGDAPVRLGGPHAYTIDAFALSGWVKAPVDVSLQHVTPDGVDFAFVVTSSGAKVQHGDRSVEAPISLDEGRWEHVGVVVDGARVQVAH